MPVLTKGLLRIDHSDEGRGEPVVLIHSSVSANRQWRALTDVLKDRYRVLAINLFGYGQTTPWPAHAPQPLYAQAQLVLALCEGLRGPLHLVGHSFGGAVALKSALLLGARVKNLVLFEPNPAHLLRQHGRTAPYLDARSLVEHVKSFGALGDWARAAEYFVDYWLGDGTWRAMPEQRRAAFEQSMAPVIHECDAIMSEETDIEAYRSLTARTLVLSDVAARWSIRELLALLGDACPHWTFQTLEGVGHMGPLTRPEVVNPIIRAFLDVDGSEWDKIDGAAGARAAA